MKLLNKDAWKNKRYTVFITSYTGLHYFNQWSHVIRNNENVQLVIVDTGNQTAASTITDIPVFQLSQNVGCAGCWNACALLGFNYYNLDKIIIGQDDAMFDENMINLIWNETTDDMLTGVNIGGPDQS